MPLIDADNKTRTNDDAKHNAGFKEKGGKLLVEEG
jgi:hypothetical protein